MVNETIAVRLSRVHPEDNPALAGCCPPPAGRHRPLVDATGQALLPRVVRALRAGATIAARRAWGHGMGGAGYPAIDPFMLAAYPERGRRLHSAASAALLRRAGLALGRAAARLVAGTVRALHSATLPAADAAELARVLAQGRHGALDTPPDYEQRRALFYGRGL